MLHGKGRTTGASAAASANEDATRSTPPSTDVILEPTKSVEPKYPNQVSRNHHHHHHHHHHNHHERGKHHGNNDVEKASPAHSGEEDTEEGTPPTLLCQGPACFNPRLTLFVLDWIIIIFVVSCLCLINWSYGIMCQSSCDLRGEYNGLFVGLLLLLVCHLLVALLSSCAIFEYYSPERARILLALCTVCLIVACVAFLIIATLAGIEFSTTGEYLLTTESKVAYSWFVILGIILYAYYIYAHILFGWEVRGGASISEQTSLDCLWAVLGVGVLIAWVLLIVWLFNHTDLSN